VSEERETYRREMQAVDPARLVFLDETAVLTNLTRRSARAPVGERAYGSAPRNWKRLTVLGAISCDGVAGVMTVPSGTTTEVFVDFLNTMLLPVLREQKPDAILVMDNLSAHKSTAVRQAVEAAGLSLRYLPRYSPDLSPIEPCWSKIKTFLRAAAARTVEVLKTEVANAIASVTAEDIQAWFRHCGYPLTS
jgi:transposase